MHHHLSPPLPFLQLTDDDDDDDESSSDSSHPTPRSSLFIYPGPPNLKYCDDLPHLRVPRRPLSLISFDSGYFSSMGKESPQSSKPFLRKQSRSDLRVPLFPINNATDVTQESPKREGVIKNLLRRKRKSMSFPSPLDLDPFASHSIPEGDPIPHASTRPVPCSFPASQPKQRNPSVSAFEVLDRFVVRRGMKHHPYSHADAPYMLAYDRTLLDNDKFSEMLLRRLNQNYSPSFHDFTHASPKTILDLGCGTGGWAVEAAEFWPSSQVIGFDLLDPARLRGSVETPSNVQWKQGNFVKYKLPFPKNTFDLVRMANLSFCVPHDRWEHVMYEVRRVLAQGGRLELIDDHLYFPYTKRPPRPSDYSRPSSSSFDDDDDDGINEDTDAEQPDGNDDDNDDDDDFVSAKSRLSTVVDPDDFSSPPPYDPVTEWNRNVDNAKSLEKLFEDMLSRKFSIHPQPSKFLVNVMDKIFGRYNQCRLHEFNLYLAPPPNQDSDDSSIGSSETQGSAGFKKAGKDFAKWVTVEWDNHKDKKPHTKGDRSSGESLSNFSSVPEAVSAKAAGRLGISPTPSRSHVAQSPGLILWPTTFIPVPPFELEMHACKHLHSLIGCKAALTEYLQDIAEEQQQPFNEQIVDDLIWDYESFRRKRFNWPSECPESSLDEEIPAVTTTPRSNTFRNPLEPPHPSRPGSGSMSAPHDPLFPREKLDFVRCIRVYSATKLDEESHFS